MTVQESSLALFNWFCSNDYFNSKIHISQILNKNFTEEDSASVLCALKEMEGQNLIKRCESEQFSHIWVSVSDFEGLSRQYDSSVGSVNTAQQIIYEYQKTTGIDLSGLDMLESLCEIIIKMDSEMSKKYVENKPERN